MRSLVTADSAAPGPIPPGGAHIVAAALYPLDNVGKILADEAVEQDRRGQLQFVEQAEDSPDADAKAVVALGVVALGLRAAALGRVGGAAGQKGELLDVERDVESEPLAARPVEVASLLNRRIVIAVVGWQLEHGPLPWQCNSGRQSLRRVHADAASRCRMKRSRGRAAQHNYFLRSSALMTSAHFLVSASM